MQDPRPTRPSPGLAPACEPLPLGGPLLWLYQEVTRRLRRPVPGADGAASR